MSQAYPPRPLLLVDDEPLTLQSLEMALRSAGINNIVSCGDSAAVMPLLEKTPVEIILLDLWMPGISGEELLEQIMHEAPDIPVVIITGVSEVDTAVRCIKAGAFDFLVKPVDRDRLVTAVMHAIKIRELQRENQLLKQRVLSSTLEHTAAFEQIVTRNEEMLAIFQYVEAVALTRHPVLITGETGVGKELIARAIHSISRPDGPFVSVNSAGLDDLVFADTLFGHVKGAFTGADRTREGMIGRAARGTLFLDEIGDLSAASQVKLLRLIQEGEFYPIGSDLAKRMDARLVVATNQQLEGGKLQFRKDLYFRLCTHRVNLPPLRERLDDLPLLLEHFLDEACREQQKQRPATPKELLAQLASQSFPGNVRQLQSMVRDAVSQGELSSRTLRARDSLRESSVALGKSNAEEGGALAFSSRLPTLAEVQEQLISEALTRAKGNRTAAARMLGISRQALHRRLKE